MPERVARAAPPNDIMPLTADQRHALLLADRTRDVGQITVVIERVLAANPDANLFDIEMGVPRCGLRRTR